MKKILAVLITLVVAIAILAGCRKDLAKPNDIKDVNSLLITTDLTNADPTVFITADSINVKENDSLKVKLKISQTLGSAQNFSYQWIITQTTQSIGNPAQYVVGKSAQLATVINLPPNLYRLIAKVTDNSTGITFFKFFQLNVFSSAWGNEGWVVLQEQPSKGGDDIGVITTRDGSVHGQVYNNVYSLANSHKLPAGTYKVNVIEYTTSLRLQKVSFFYPNGGMQVRSYDFLDSVSYQNWSLTPPPVTNLQVNTSMGGSASGWEFVINNNQIAYRQVSALSIKTPPVNFSPPFLGSFTIAPFIIDGSSSDPYVTLYDQVNHCFVGLNVSTQAFFGVSTTNDIPNGHFLAYAGSAATLNPATGIGFDMNKMRHNLIYAENSQPINTSNGYWNTFFRNNTADSTFLVQFQRALAYNNVFTGLSSGGNGARILLKNANCPGINTATQFACATSLIMPGGAFYYVNGSNIYTCKVAVTKTTTSGTATANASIGLSFPGGTIIKVMKVFNSGYAAAPTTEGKVLVVATDETANGKGNNVYFFNLSATGDITGSPSSPADVYTGFDKINDIAFKKALGK